MHINSLESIYKLITCDTMIEILRKTSKLTIIMWTFLAEDYFIQMSIHKFSKHLLLWVSLVCTVSRLAWEAACLLISQMADWARLGPHEVARARGPDTSSSETLAEIRGELLEYGTAAETRKSIFLRIDGWFLRPDGQYLRESYGEISTEWVMRASARHITLIYCLR